MHSYFCYNCKYELFQFNGEGEVERICPKCRRINYSSRTAQCFGPRGEEFFKQALQLLCKTCRCVLCNVIGDMLIVVTCKNCHQNMKYNTKDIKEQQKRVHRPLNMLKHGF